MEPVRNLALTAGPGAGKTEMLAQRADFLLRTGLCRYPQRILAISFKVDASRNLARRVKLRCGNVLAARFDSQTFHGFAKRLIDRFRLVLSGKDALDADYTIGDQRITHRQITFADLIPLACHIVKASAVARNAIHATYTDVLCDEFQDCNGSQYELLRLACGGAQMRVCAVGDTKQRIMGWAGALEGIFVRFAEDFDALPLNLYRNFRSQPRLLRMQNEMIKTLDPKAVMAGADISGEGGVIKVLSFDTDQEEADSVATLIHTWIRDENVAPSEIAVLVSKQAEHYAAHLIAALRTAGVACRNDQQLQDLAAEPFTCLLVDYLLVLYGSREPGAYSRVMDILTAEAWDDQEEAALRTKWQRIIRDERLHAGQPGGAADDIDAVWRRAKAFLLHCGKALLISLSPDYESIPRLREVMAETRKRLTEMLEVQPSIPEALHLMSGERSVRIMTIHKSKGLEFDSVVLLAVENETYWGKAEEERCAFFVGMARAKRRLLLTHSESRERPVGMGGQWRVARTKHAEFLGYADPHLSA